MKSTRLCAVLFILCTLETETWVRIFVFFFVGDHLPGEALRRRHVRARGFHGGFEVPVGVSFPERGMRNDQHDAVAATVCIPVTSVPGGAAQPCVAEVPSSGALQLAAAEEQPDHWASPEKDEPWSPIWDTSTSEDEEAVALHKEMQILEEDETCPAHVQEELGRLLFMKKTVTTGNIKRQYVASSAETQKYVKLLLRRRLDLMNAHGLGREAAFSGGAPLPAPHLARSN